MKQPLLLVNPAARVLPRTYIYCADKPDDPLFAQFAQRARGDAAWRYRELPTGHEAVWTMPREVADLLLEGAS
jgi:hypothetical protein